MATVVAAAFAVPAAAASSTAGGAGSTAGSLPRPAFSKSLHAEFARLRGHVRMGARAGIVPPLRTGPASSRQAARPAAVRSQTCTEPNCNLVYHGGPVQHNPKVYVLFWGPGWENDTSQQATEAYLIGLYKGLGASGDTWSQTTSQYSDGTGHPTFPGGANGVLVASGTDVSTPPSEVGQSDIATEAAAAASTFKITDVADAQVVVALQSGTCFSDGFAGSSCQPVQASYCAWHSATVFDNKALAFTNMPYQLDAGSSCGENFVNSGSAGTLDGFSITGGHEYAETVTDPVPDNGYIDTGDFISGGEIGDKCAWGGELWNTPDPIGDVTLATGSYAMQSLWSNATGGCVMAGTLPFSVTPLGNQASTLGHGVSVQVHASTSPATTLTYSATGLPGGLSIGQSTGLIKGTVSGTVKVYTTTVKVAYYAGSQSFTVKWTVDAVGQVTGTWAKCVDDANGKTTAGNKIDILSCTGKAPQKITYTPGGQLQVQNGCITGGNLVFFEPCSGAANKIWTRTGNEYVNKATGKCLTDPNNSKVNGTQLTAATCANKINQRWTLP